MACSELFHPEAKATRGTGASSAFRTAQGWLQDCQSSPYHSSCQAAIPRDAPDLPTRIICVGDETSEPFLFETQGTRAPYCVLSYCWGTTPALKTTKSTIQNHRVSIPIHTLPATIHHAILATKALGIQYLWVDALCIIQDDEEDWAREAAQMGSIYARATLTLSSLVSSNTTDGLFQPRCVRQPKPVPLPAMRLSRIHRPQMQQAKDTDMDDEMAKSPQICVLNPLWLDREAPYKGPVHSRGWTLQEQVLSTRTLYFGAGMLQWECLSLYTTEAAPIKLTTYPVKTSQRGSVGEKEEVREKAREQRLIVRGLGSELETVWLSRLRTFEAWQDLLMQYTGDRSLSRPSDCLPAFLGISTYMAPHLGSRFVGGLWDGDWFIESLCWELKTPSPDLTGATTSTTTAVTASWTWASHPGAPVTFWLVRIGDREKRSLISDVSMDDVHISTAQSRVTGAIRLRGRVGRINLLRNPASGAFKELRNGSGVEDEVESYFDHEEKKWEPVRRLFFDCNDRGIKDGDAELWYLDLIEVGPAQPSQPYKGRLCTKSESLDGESAYKVQLLMRKVAGKNGNVFRRVGLRSTAFGNSDMESIIKFQTILKEDRAEKISIRLV